jgi:hypothetical protein
LGTVQGGRIAQYELSASPVEFGAAGLFPADRIKGTSKGLVGAIVVEPQDSCWVTDPGTRAQATVWKGATDVGNNSLIGECASTPAGSSDSFRDFVTVMHNDVNLRYGGDASEAGGPNCADPNTLATVQCAVPNISAEGPLGPPEDPQDSGQKAINYGTDPLWFRLGIAPSTPFGLIHRNAALENTIPQVFSNSLVGEDPQTEVYAASPTGPQEGRVRLLMPGGHARGTTYTLHGHEWQRQPYINDSSEIGDNIDPGSEYYGTQEGINPAGHWDIVTDLGGPSNVEGDYLFRDQASFGSYQGLWGLLRFNYTPPVASATAEVTKYQSVDIDLVSQAFDLDGDAVSATIVSGPNYGMFDLATMTYSSTAWPGCVDPFACTDEFTYTVTDAKGLVSDVGTATVTVLNTAPVANTDTAEILATTSVDIDVLDNDTDAEGDLNMNRVPTPPNPAPQVAIVTGPLDRLGNPVGDYSVADGTLTYTPPASFNGLVLFTYTVTDESGAVSNEALVRVKVRVDDVTINTAQFQDNNDRWNIGGDCSENGNTIKVYFGDQSLVEENFMGEGICVDNAWKVNGQLFFPDGNLVQAISTSTISVESFPGVDPLVPSGAIIEGFPVTIR